MLPKERDHDSYVSLLHGMGERTGRLADAPTMLADGFQSLAPKALEAGPDTPAGKTWASVLLEPGTALGNRYKILEILGEGAWGCIQSARPGVGARDRA